MEFEEDHDYMFLPCQGQALLISDHHQNTKAHHEEEEEEEERLERAKRIEEITGYRFQDQTLLLQAFTHHSYEEGAHPSYERLAYAGDSILDFLITKEQYSLYPDMDPGQLTRLRAANVDTEKLARAALKHQLHKLLRHNKMLLAVQIKEFENGILEYPWHWSGLIDAPKVLADIVESLIGAIFIDSNSSTHTWKALKSLLEPMITPSSLPTHPMVMLQELCQTKGFTVELRDFWKERGEIEVVVDNEAVVGRAKYNTKRIIAKNRAALHAYNQMLQKFQHKLL